MWKKPAIYLGIEYHGLPGLTRPCVDAIKRLVQSRERIGQASLLSCNSEHAFLLTLNGGDRVAVRTGFGSGYAGEGSRGLSFVLSLLDGHGVEIDEYIVDRTLLQRLDEGSLREEDISTVMSKRPVRPTRWYDYITERHEASARTGQLWSEFEPIIPLSVIDERLVDLAIDFWQRPDANLLTGYRRLEDLVRSRTGLEEHGGKLFSQAFTASDSKLHWPGIEVSEQIGRSQLFTGAFMAFRNPRAHREPSHEPSELLCEFLILNTLYRLERVASPRRTAKLA